MGAPGTWDLDHLYDSARWHRIRKLQLAEHPLCKFCAERGIVTPATICDHVEPHRGDINKFWVGALQSLCLSPPAGTRDEFGLTKVRSTQAIVAYSVPN